MRIGTTTQKKKLLMHLKPTTIIVLSFLLLILAGTVLLSLPAAARDGKSTGFLDALFTSTSAVCVTGLVVVDTYKHWSVFGQIVILTLIQVGALGIITFTTFFSALLGRKMRLRNMILAQESINYFSFAGIMKLVRNVLLVTLGIELAGTLALSVRFVPVYGLQGFYLSLFHSISAFCSAGFDLMSISGDTHFISLLEYNNDPIVLYTIAAIMTVGSLGFIVWKDLYDYRKNKALMLHTKLVLSFTIVLIMAGAVLFYVFEAGNHLTMGELNTSGKINASLFQSITARAAGYNSIDIGGMNEISKLLTTIFMFIGGAPGSTSGGIKVTTFGIILFAAISQVRGTDDTIIFKRRVTPPTISKALALFVLSAVAVFFTTTVMLAVEKKPIIDILFEVTSAFGTSGLSTGLTPGLHPFSKLLLVLMMFFGRVGPVTFALAMTIRTHKNNSDVVYPEGRVIVG